MVDSIDIPAPFPYKRQLKIVSHTSRDDANVRRTWARIDHLDSVVLLSWQMLRHPVWGK